MACSRCSRAARGRSGVELERLVALLAADAAQVGQGGLLRLAHVIEQATRRADRERLLREPEAREVARAELLAQLSRGTGGFEVPGRTLPDRAGGPAARDRRGVLGDEQLGGSQPLEIRGE